MNRTRTTRSRTATKQRSSSRSTAMARAGPASTLQTVAVRPQIASSRGYNASSSFSRQTMTATSSSKRATALIGRRGFTSSSSDSDGVGPQITASDAQSNEPPVAKKTKADEQKTKVDEFFEATYEPIQTISDAEFKQKFDELGLKFGPEQLDVSNISLTPKPVPMPEAIQICRSWSTKTYDQNIYLSLNLGLDPRKPNQMVRGMAPVPHGSGQKVVLAVFAVGEKAAEATAAGADIVGGEDLIAQVQSGKIDFTRCIATPDMMRHLSKVARVLGPRGLMPNPKVGTVTNDITQAVQNSKQGQIEFRCDRKGVVHAILGKASWPVSQIEENMTAFIRAIDSAKPSGAKGVYFKSAFVGCDGAMSAPLDTRLAPFRS